MGERLFSKILVPVDFSPCSEEAFRLALALARLFQAEVLLLHVIDVKSLTALNRLGLALPSEESGQKKRLRHHARLQARRLLQSDEAKGVMIRLAGHAAVFEEPDELQSDEAKGVMIRRLLAEGVPFVEIARTARMERVDLVVMGSYGGQVESVDKIFFGSTAEKVVRTAGCPVLTVPLPARLRPRRTEPREGGGR